MRAGFRGSLNRVVMQFENARTVELPAVQVETWNS